MAAANTPRPGLRFVDRLILVVAWVVTGGLLYGLGFYTGKGTQERRLGMEERVVRLPVTATPPPPGERTKSGNEFTFYESLVAKERARDAAKPAPGPTPTTLAPRADLGPIPVPAPAEPGSPAATAPPPAGAAPAPAGTPPPPAGEPMPAAGTRAAPPAPAPAPSVPAAAPPATTPPAVATRTPPSTPPGAATPPTVAHGAHPGATSPPPITVPPLPPARASVAAETAPPPPPPAGTPRTAAGPHPATTPPAPGGVAARPVTPETPPAGGRGWTVQATARSRSEAEDVQATLRSRGIETAIVPVQRNGVTQYRLRVGRYATEEQAAEAVRRLRAEGVGGAFVASE